MPWFILPKSMKHLENKVILVTGAGQGMGRGIALAVSQAGAKVVAGDLHLEGVEETIALVEEAGGTGLALFLDVTKADTISAAVEKIVQEFGRLDGLVNNAGVVRISPALDSPPEERALQFDVNVEGVFLCSQIAARQMISQDSGGSMVNIASEAGKVGHMDMAGYNASKAAVISMSRSFALEWSKYRINVNAVCPGGVETPMLLDVAKWIAQRDGGDPHEIVRTLHPPQLGRNIQPIEIGRVVAFLLSDDAIIIRGQAVNVDGGETPY